MPRYISKYARYVFTAQRDRMMVLADGQNQELQRMINCRFEPWDVTEWEYEKAVEVFRFRGMPSKEPVMIDGQVGEAVDDPRFRISSYDTSTQNLSPEEEEMVIGRLEGDPHYGTDFIRVDPPKLPAPWPSYDNLVAGGRAAGGGGRTTALVATEIVETVAKLGLDPLDVAHYERVTKNRAEVVQALERLAASGDEPGERPVEVTA